MAAAAVSRPPAPINGHARDDRAYFDSLTTASVRPLWTVMKKLNAGYPVTKATPHVWRWEEIRPLILEAGDVVPIELAERRVLQLINPGIDKDGYTLDTLYAGIQSIKPREVAPAHRHVAFALRFIIEGEKGYTCVEGKKMYMRRGDVLLTPSWNWHDHGSESDSTMLWLDGLNLPLFQAFPFNFTQQYEEKEFPAKVVEHSDAHFPWAAMHKRLLAVEGDAAELEYTLPDGHPVGKTISAHAWRITAGRPAPPKHETTNFIFHVIEGSGTTKVEHVEAGKKYDITWKRGDTFCIPSWHRFQLVADAGEDVFLFSFTDKPMLDTLGWWRTPDHV